MNSTQVSASLLPPPPFAIEVSNIGSLDNTQTGVTAETEKSVEGSSTTEPQIQIFRCDCGKICQRKENLTTHKKFCTKDASMVNFSTTVSFPCPLCTTTCATNSALQKHQGSQKCIKRQAAKSKSLSLTLALSVTDSQTLESFGVQCHNCKCSFKSKAGMISHSKSCKVRWYLSLNIVQQMINSF